MKRNKHLNRKLTLFFLIFSVKVSATLLITDVRCENMQNPLGIDKLQPSFNWKINCDLRGTFQKACQI
jgi:hypothetical protein